jgi:phenylpyruvate tautomerase PptA (4-oxalocrotonate tautomerase family)
MNKDSQLIFEAYLEKKAAILKEAPIYGDLDTGYTGDIEKAPGDGYGVGAAAKREGKSKKEIADKLLNVIKTKLFKQVKNVVNGKEYQLFYPGSKMKFRSDLEKLIKNELKIGGTQARYTARIVDNLLNVLRVDPEGGVVTEPRQVEKALDAGVEGKSTAIEVQPSAPVSTANKFVKNENVRFIKEWQPIFIELPEEIEVQKGDLYDSPELKNEVIEAITRAYDKKMASDNEVVQDFIDSLKYKNSYVPYTEKPEGEGSGEVETVEEYPEDDDATAELRNMGAIPGRRGYDPGGFSYSD